MREQVLCCGHSTIRLRHERCYTLGSADNPRRYGREYRLSDGLFTSYHAVECEEGGRTYSSIIAGSGGATTIHEHSAIVRDGSLFLAVADSVCRLAIPNLEMIWHKRLDEATCFGIYWSERHRCLIVHGELGISRVSLDGEVAWRASGKDIFSEVLRLSDEHIVVEDSNHERYQIDLVTGRSRIIR